MAGKRYARAVGAPTKRRSNAPTIWRRNGQPDVVVPTEDAEQVLFYSWVRQTTRVHPELDAMYHCSNRGGRDAAEGMRMKRKGVKPGIPDNHLAKPRGGYHGLQIEMKKTVFSELKKWGHFGENQVEIITQLRADGYFATVARGHMAAIAITLAYLNGDREKLQALDEFDMLVERMSA